MQRTAHYKLAAGFLAGLFLLLALVLPAAAASERPQAVLDRLQVLQRADINPGWLPDIRANESAVQGLLDLYEACTPAERAEFTEQQNADLRAYFTALYQVQGKDTAGVDDLFASGGASSSQSRAPSSSSSSRPASSSQPASSSSSRPASSSSAASSPAASSSPVSSAASASSSSAAVSSAAGGTVVPSSRPPASSSGVESTLPLRPGQPPQYPKDDGVLLLLGNPAVGAALVMLLCIVAGLLFVRFLAALRAAGRVPPEDSAALMRAQELFGEGYAASGLAFEDMGDASLAPPPRPNRAPVPRPAASEPSPNEHARSARRARRRKADVAETAPEAAVAAPEAAETAPKVDAAPKAPPKADAAPKAAPVPPEPAAETAATRPPAPAPAPAPRLQPRTGRPGRMPFHPGPANDLDSIDD